MELINARLNRLSDIFSGIAQVCLASIVIPFVLDKANSNSVTLAVGVILFLVFVILSLFIARPER